MVFRSVLTSVVGAAWQNHLPVNSPACLFVPSPPLRTLSSFRRNQWTSVLTRGDERSSPVRSVSHYLLPVRQTNCSQRRIPAFTLKSVPDYSKLLALLQHSSRPSRHPQAVQLWVPLPVIPAVGHLSLRLTTITPCSGTTQVHHSTF